MFLHVLQLRSCVSEYQRVAFFCSQRHIAVTTSLVFCCVCSFFGPAADKCMFCFFVLKKKLAKHKKPWVFIKLRANSLFFFRDAGGFPGRCEQEATEGSWQFLKSPEANKPSLQEAVPVSFVGTHVLPFVELVQALKKVQAAFGTRGLVACTNFAANPGCLQWVIVISVRRFWSLKPATAARDR